MSKHHAKTPEEEVEPLADPEPDEVPPPTDDDDAYEEPKKHAGARDQAPPPEGPFKPPDWPDWIQWGPSTAFEISGPHHS